MRSATARAATAPATTLVLDARHLDAGIGRDELARHVLPARREAMRRRADLGAKTIMLLQPSAPDDVPVSFFQGMPDGSVDPTIEVCFNSLACALAVGRHVWGAIENGPLTVTMGGERVLLEEVLA
jgi:hypothetical protein